jgi:hypothetical protein
LPEKSIYRKLQLIEIAFQLSVLFSGMFPMMRKAAVVAYELVELLRPFDDHKTQKERDILSELDIGRDN